MKYESNTKTTRNKAIVSLRENDPSLSQQEIGKMFDITRQRVSFIIKEYYRKLGQSSVR